MKKQNLYKEIMQKKLSTYKKNNTLTKAFKILKQKPSKRFVNQPFSRQIQQVDEKMESDELLKIAEALRDIKFKGLRLPFYWMGSNKDEPDYSTWDYSHFRLYFFIRHWITRILDIDDYEATALVQSNLYGINKDKFLKDLKNKLKKIFNKDLKYIIKNLDIKKFTNEIEKSPDRFNKKYGAGDMFGSILFCLRSEYPGDGLFDEFVDVYGKSKEFKLFINKLQFTGKLLPKLSNNFVLEEYFDFGTVSHSLISSKFKKNYLYVFCERREFYNESKSVYEKHDIIDNYVEEIFKKKFGRVQFSEYLMKRNKILHLSNSLTINKTPDFDDLDFDDLVKNLDLNKFIKFLDKRCKCKYKSTNLPTLYISSSYKENPGIVHDLVSSSTSKTMSYEKLRSAIYKNEGDFIHLAIQDGKLLPHASNNFKLEKVIFPVFDDGDVEHFYDFQIISSKINKSYYILLDYYNRDDENYEDIYFCMKKFKNKNLAINFIEEEQKKLKNFYKSKGY